MSARRIIAIAVTAAALVSTSYAQNTGYATYSGSSDGVCSGVSSSLPVVAMNAAQFGGGSACGQCVLIQGTGNGAGSNPVSTAPYVAIVNNVCPQCAPGDIDLQESGNGKFGITWSFTACPGSGRKLIEGGRKLIVAEQQSSKTVVLEDFPTVGESVEGAMDLSVDRNSEESHSTVSDDLNSRLQDVQQEGAAPVSDEEIVMQLNNPDAEDSQQEQIVEAPLRGVAASRKLRL